ncbi:MAG: hypothetical protein GEU90_07555 [Gemmatimonas sp.]|nr:hypothetical protein [Gemmatimonas sp.]
MVFPPAFVTRMHAMLGDEVDEFLAALANPREGLRTNSLRSSSDQLGWLLPFELTPIPGVSDGWFIRSGERPGKHPYHAAGLYYVQDPGSMLVAAAMDPRPGERVLDLAAAPGGKATHLAALMRNEGVLVANDVARGRARELAGNLERCGARNCIVLSETADRLARHFGAWFDRVLLDAPCSGESMFHKSAAAVADWSPESVAGCARRQGDLLRSAADLTRPGGLLVYSTCTFSPEENEAIVAAFLTRDRRFAPVELPVPERAQRVGEGAYRLWPHRNFGAGHFVAGLRRSDASEGDGPLGKPWRLAPSRDALRRLAEFAAETFCEGVYDVARVEQLGREICELPADSPSMRGLRVVRAGLSLGTLERDRLKPAYALALAVPPESAAHEVALELEDERVEAYLRGHPIEAEGDPGWAPIMVEGFALGWGKRVDSTVKNHYPKGLRWTG